MPIAESRREKQLDILKTAVYNFQKMRGKRQYAVYGRQSELGAVGTRYKQIAAEYHSLAAKLKVFTIKLRRFPSVTGDAYACMA